jgi:carboxyl-terminal processing protease
VKPQSAAVKAGEKEKEKDKDKETEARAPKPKDATPPLTGPKPADENTPKSNGALTEPLGEGAIEDDVQLQKAVELLKTWKIFKELRPI